MRLRAVALALVGLVGCAACTVEVFAPAESDHTVWLTTEPVARAALVSGSSVVLRYVIATPAGVECRALLRSGRPTPI